MLRLIHTADWHLGHTLHGFDRHREHELFLDWLLETLVGEHADALIVAGDIYDTANPPSAAQAQLYRFLAEARRRLPNLEIVLTAGNHDSPARIEAPTPLLSAIGVTAVGLLHRTAEGRIDATRHLIPLTDDDGNVSVICAAVPFLRAADLPPSVDPDLDPLVDGVRRVYQEVLAAARSQAGADAAVVTTGHCYCVSGQISEMSERRVLGGNQHALPADVFGGADYAALGHLHLGQRVAGADTIRYSGSPLPLSMTERTYRHQVVAVTFDRTHVEEVHTLPVPRSVELLRYPVTGAAPIGELESQLASLAAEEHAHPKGLEPFLEVAVRLDGPEPGLRERIQKILVSAPVRLARITAEIDGTGHALADGLATEQIHEIAPEEVFSRCYRQRHDDEPPAALREAFAELLESVEQGEP